jgi:hypothetical protein
MPEATMHGNNFFTITKNEIGGAGQVFPVKAISEAHGMDEAPNDKFRLRIFPSNPGHAF